MWTNDLVSQTTGDHIDDHWIDVESYKAQGNEMGGIFNKRHQQHFKPGIRSIVMLISTRVDKDESFKFSQGFPTVSDYEQKLKGGNASHIPFQSVTKKKGLGINNHKKTK